MPISDRDTYATLLLLLKRHGDTAAIEATVRADEVLGKGDLDGQRVRMRVLRAIDSLNDTTPKGPKHRA